MKDGYRLLLGVMRELKRIALDVNPLMLKITSLVTLLSAMRSCIGL